jgi:hypothetical protein
MYTTYHLKSPAEINADVIEAIKTAFKGKRIVITVEEEQDETAYLLNSPQNKEMLLKSIEQANNGELIAFKPANL